MSYRAPIVPQLPTAFNPVFLMLSQTCHADYRMLGIFQPLIETKLCFESLLRGYQPFLLDAPHLWCIVIESSHFVL